MKDIWKEIKIFAKVVNVFSKGMQRLQSNRLILEVSSL